MLVRHHLEWGKWVKTYHNMDEVNGPVQMANPLKFCSAGRQMSATGTEGRVTLEHCDHHKQLTISWNHPWAGPSYLTEEFDENSFDVRRTGDYWDWQPRYDVTVKNP